MTENSSIPGELNFESKYEIVCLLAQGTFSTVHKVFHLDGRKSFAMKKFKDKECAEKEISWLQQFQGEKNFVKLVDILNEPHEKISIVMDLCREDFFFILIVYRIILNDAEKKSFLLQLLNGLHTLHSKGLMHRDVKSANLLLSYNGIVKICDFSSVTESPPANALRSKIYSNNVVFRWYKAPEILLGDKKYCEKIDIWAAGCVAFELWSNGIFFEGFDRETQLKRVTETCGFLSREIWDEVETLDGYSKYFFWAKKFPDSHLKNHLKQTTGDEAATDLIVNLLQLNPYRRPTAGSLKKHRYFKLAPPKPAGNLKRILELVDEAIPLRLQQERSRFSIEELPILEENVQNKKDEPDAQEEKAIVLEEHLVF